ncbi:sensor histidine kinase [Pedobacter jeongneungensis]|uniref:sensor histidine kinase n=1 Tax=Pedobacter jeongneungensis TaxID=947309 RepID=UPI00046A64D3|nr:PAS domain S-box protein [Pedobacter jeongneungensis]
MKESAEILSLIKGYETRESDLMLNIAQLKSLNEALRIADERSAVLNSIIESSDDAIVSKDLNSIVTSWNDAAERIFGYNASEMIGKSIMKIIPPDRAEEEPHILGQLRQGIRVDHFETERLRKDGTLINVSLTISPIKDRNGNVIGLSKIARDITDKKNIEIKKNEFIGFVSHELKTPLTSLRSYIQVALHKAKKDELEFISQALSRAELQTKKMENMISDFLSISKFEDGHMKINPTRFDMAKAIKENLEDARIASAKHILVYAGANEAYVNGDQEKLSLVLTNLISNAQKYSPNGGTITINCQQKDQHFFISVSDQGIGISTADQKLMFGKFFRVNSEQTKFISGFGIGLYLASTIINLHQSSITVESEPDKGSTFSFHVAAAMETA